MTDTKLKKEETKINVTRQGWSADKVSAEASQIDEDEIQRKFLRGDETKGNPDERDHAGTVKTDETPQGRKEKEIKIKEERNGN